MQQVVQMVQLPFQSTELYFGSIHLHTRSHMTQLDLVILVVTQIPHHVHTKVRTTVAEPGTLSHGTNKISQTD